MYCCKMLTNLIYLTLLLSDGCNRLHFIFKKNSATLATPFEANHGSYVRNEFFFNNIGKCKQNFLHSACLGIPFRTVELKMKELD